MKKIHYYGFLDVVIDVFYSIILYNAFIAFPGFGSDFLLMLLALFVMLNYWWIARNYSELPKYYLFDFYAIVVVMFIFAQWSNYFSDIHGFLGVITIFFAFDSLYSFLSIFAHREKKDEQSLQYYAVAELILTLVYGFLFLIIREKTLLHILLITLPYCVYFWVSFKKGLIKTRFIDNGEQPY